MASQAGVTPSAPCFFTMGVVLYHARPEMISMPPLCRYSRWHEQVDIRHVHLWCIFLYMTYIHIGTFTISTSDSSTARSFHGKKKNFKRSTAALLHLGYLNQNSYAWFSGPTFLLSGFNVPKTKKHSRLRHPAVLEKGVVHIFELWRWISKVKHAPEVLAERDFWSEIHRKKGAQLHFNHFHCKKMSSPIKTPKRIRSTNHQATTR